MIEVAVEYRSGDQTYRGFLARPSGSSMMPAVLIAHEAPGLTGHCRDVAREMAAQGYAAFAADYVGEGRVLTTMDEVATMVAGWERNPDVLRASLASALDRLLTVEGVDAARVGGLGYCFGGQALLEFARTGAPLAAITGFHSGLSVNRPDESRRICSRILMCMGADDPITSRAHREAFEDEMTQAGVDWRMIVYGQTAHSFTNPEADDFGIPGVSYNRASAADAWDAMLAFFRTAGLEDPQEPGEVA